MVLLRKAIQNTIMKKTMLLWFTLLLNFDSIFAMSEILPEIALQKIAGLVFQYTEKFQKLPDSIEDLYINSYTKSDVNIVKTFENYKKCGFIIHISKVTFNKIEIILEYENFLYLCSYEDGFSRFYLNGELYHEFRYIRVGTVIQIVDEKIYEGVISTY